MKRLMTGVVAAAMLVPALTACGGDSDFCSAAPEDVDVSDPASMKTALEDIVDDAPDDVRGDVEVLIEQLGAFEEDPTSVDTDAMTEAADNLAQWEEDNC